MKTHMYYKTLQFIGLCCRINIRNIPFCKIKLQHSHLLRKLTCLKMCNNYLKSCFCTSSTSIQDFKLSNAGLNSHLMAIINDYKSLKEQTINQESRDLILKVQEMEPLVNVIQYIWKHNEDVAQLEQLVADLIKHNLSENLEMIKMANDELNSLQKREEDLKEKLLPLLLPKESTDHMDILLELGAGAGGQEAMLFTSDILNMYTNYAQWKGWNCQLLDFSESDLGGVRRATLSITGEMVGETLKFESGVHRIQRVPKTERAGRMHTSTMTVAILPQPTEVEVHINPKDITMETKTARGPGGQHVNKTESAVRITHIPTGIVIECQATRSQIKNRELALQSLRARIYDIKQQEKNSKCASEKKMQVGSADRAEKVRTYNYNHDRITDHRIGATYYNITELFKGREHLDDFIKHLRKTRYNQRLQLLLENKRI